MPWLYAHTEDNKIIEYKGDSGPMSDAYWRTTKEEAEKNNWKYEEYPNMVVAIEHNAKPRVGVVMRVGSPYGRSYSAQDWWQTTEVTEILEEWMEDDIECIKFRTKNSIYIWKS
jgi:hypothetical protein